MGGDSAAHCTRQVMKRLMTETVGCQLNWRGNGGKTGLANSMIARLIFSKCSNQHVFVYTVNYYTILGSVRKNFKCSETMVFNAAKGWLKNSPKRLRMQEARAGMLTPGEDQEESD